MTDQPTPERPRGRHAAPPPADGPPDAEPIAEPHADPIAEPIGVLGAEPLAPVEPPAPEPLPEDPADWTPPPYEPKAAPPAPPGRPRRRVRPWLVGVGVLVLLAGAAVAAVLVINTMLGSAAGPEDARATVLRFDRAFETSDCELFQQVTTARMRDSLYDGDFSCATFEANADSFHVGGEYRYEVVIGEVAVDGDTATVATKETDGASQEPVERDYTYTLELADGVWTITALE